MVGRQRRLGRAGWELPALPGDGAAARDGGQVLVRRRVDDLIVLLLDADLVGAQDFPTDDAVVPNVARGGAESQRLRDSKERVVG